MQFDQFAGEYQQILDRSVAVSGEDSAYFAEYKARYLRSVLPSTFGGMILDYGCGVGLLSSFLKRYFPDNRLDGFDISSKSIGQVPQNLTSQGFFTSDFQQLSNAYGLIVIANVMHHVPLSERQSTVDQLAQRLGDGGLLAICEHNPANPVTRKVVADCPFDSDAILLPPGESTMYVKQSKLQVLRRDYIVFMPHALRFLRFLEPWLRWLPLGAQYVVLAEKHA